MSGQNSVEMIVAPRPSVEMEISQNPNQVDISTQQNRPRTEITYGSVRGPRGEPGPEGPPGEGVSEEELQEHVDSPTPHPVYDDGPSLELLYENAKV